MTDRQPKTTAPTKFFMLLSFVLIALLFWLVLYRTDGTSMSIQPNQIDIREQDGKIQWKPLGGDWQTITNVQMLRGERGQDGRDGEDGADGSAGVQGQRGDTGDTGAAGISGQNGASGTDGRDGRDGVDGVQGPAGVAGQDGIDGRDGADGQDGAQGVQGEQGVAGADGTDGADGQNGADGREIELQKSLDFIEWRWVGEPGWRNLIAYTDLKGEKGDAGDTGPANTLSIGTVSRTDCTPTASITGTTPSQTLNLGIPGLPLGGAAGQVLQKNSDDDCDATWADTHVIVAAGRPDISSSMDSATQAKVATAASGTEFRSTDGPQGAWKWMKQGSSWVVTQGNTGWILVPSSKMLNSWVGVLYIARVDSRMEVWIDYVRDGTDLPVYELPVGFWPMPADRDVSLPIFAANMRHLLVVSPSTGLVSRNNTTPAPTGGGTTLSYSATGWPTTLEP